MFKLATFDFSSSVLTRDMVRSWCAIQNMLNAAANISKALWGQGGKLAAERKELRDSIEVLDDSPLRSVTMRNIFEHFDERLDKWWKESKGHSLADFNFGDPHEHIQRFDEIDIFRNFLPRTGELIFWSQRFDLQAIANEIERILPKVEQEARKRHWEPRTSRRSEAASSTPDE